MLKLSPLQLYYLADLLDTEKDKISSSEASYFNKTIRRKVQEEINRFARQVGENVDNSLPNLKAKENED